ncbi:MAG: hypothetical protein JXL80_03550 [Planctomycetes bacterium]|nr:hypothetical protein [Planctomycetota bacterium]
MILSDAAHRLSGLLRHLRLREPRTVGQLWQFVRCYYGLAIPRRRVCPGHVAPMEYVAGSFFQTHGDLVVWANRGGAKTELGSVATHLESIFRPGLQTRILGGSLQQSERMYEYLGAKWRPHFADLLADQPRSRRTELTNGSVIEILTQSQRGVRGQRVQRVRCDEVDEFDPDIWRAVQFVTQSRGSVRASIEAFSTMHHPYGLMSQVVDGAWNVAAGGDEDDDRDAPRGYRGFALMAWCLWETIERCTGDRSCSRCPLAEDCRGRARQADGFLRIDDAIAQMRRSGREAWESEMLCLRPRQEHLVFSRFNPQRHVRRLSPDGRSPIYRSLDFGYVNPFVCLWAQVIGDDPETAVVHVLDEYVESRKTVSEHATVLASRPWPIRATFCDPAGWQRGDVTGSGACHELARHGILTTSCRSGIMEGVDRVRALLAPALGTERLVVDPRCERLIRALASYHYPPGAGAAGAELPEKDGTHDHLIDALRYLVVNLFGRGRGQVRSRAYW